MYRLFEFSPSGNAYKVRLLLTQLKIPFQRVEIDITQGESDTPEFLKMNPNGRIPVLELSNGRYLFESNAILWYLAHGTPFLPQDKWQCAQVLQWMFFEQYSHEPNIATPRYWISILKEEEKHQSELEKKRELGYSALSVMEEHLKSHEFFVGDRYSIADVALYAYTHVADEGGFDLGRFPSIRRWFRRIEGQQGYIRITD